MSTRVSHRIRRPVERGDATRSLLLMLISFAASVVGTRLFLELTGYPQVGNSELHIAHVLWGGLLLFAASLLPLILANRWAYPAAAILSGAGVGLFMDEVGKFITQSNDYFYPLAAPIIYAFFLLTVLLYLQVRRPSLRDYRAELYFCLDRLGEVLDHDLDAAERADLETRLRRVRDHAPHPDLKRLANNLLAFVTDKHLQVAPRHPVLWERWLRRLEAFEQRWLGRTTVRLALAVGLILLSLAALGGVIVPLLAITNPQNLEAWIAQLIAAEEVRSPTGLIWFTAWVLLDGAIGAMLLVAAVLLLIRQDRLGVRLGILVLLAALTVVNLLAFYFNQFATVVWALTQFTALLALLRYRQRFFVVQRAEKTM